MSANLATQYLRDHNETLKDYEGLCGELANVIAKDIPDSKIVYVGGPAVFDTTAWTYHMVVMVEGVIHDAWRRRAMPLAEWLQKFDCEWPIEIMIDGEEVFEGLCEDFSFNTQHVAKVRESGFGKSRTRIQRTGLLKA